MQVYYFKELFVNKVVSPSTITQSFYKCQWQDTNWEPLLITILLFAPTDGFEPTTNGLDFMVGLEPTTPMHMYYCFASPLPTELHEIQFVSVNYSVYSPLLYHWAMWAIFYRLNIFVCQIICHYQYQRTIRNISWIEQESSNYEFDVLSILVHYHWTIYSTISTHSWNRTNDLVTDLKEIYFYKKGCNLYLYHALTLWAMWAII